MPHEDIIPSTNRVYHKFDVPKKQLAMFRAQYLFRIFVGVVRVQYGSITVTVIRLTMTAC